MDSQNDLLISTAMQLLPLSRAEMEVEPEIERKKKAERIQVNNNKKVGHMVPVPAHKSSTQLPGLEKWVIR